MKLIALAAILALAIACHVDELAPRLPFHELRLAVEALHDALRR